MAYRRHMTRYDVPRDEEGRRLCEHCMVKPVPASLGTKPRRYCSRNCRQRAYEARKTGRAIREAVAVEARRQRTSRDNEGQKTRDVHGATSADDKKDKPPTGMTFNGMGFVPMRLDEE
jgi:hypothetical protein